MSSTSLFTLSQDQYVVAASVSWSIVVELLRERTRALINEACPDLIFLRGEAVVRSDGQTCMVAGPTFSGKTRLAQALLGAGGVWHSQGLLAIDNEGMVLPFPLPEKPSVGLSPDAVVCLPFVPEAEWNPDSVSAGRMVLELTPALVVNKDEMAEALKRLGALCSRARLRVRGNRADVGQVVPWLNQQLTAIEPA